MPSKQLQRLEKLMSAFVDGVVQPEDLKDAIDALVDLVQKTEARLAQAIKARDSKVDEVNTQLLAKLSRDRAQLERLIEQAKEASLASIEKQATSLSKAITALQASIPSVTTRLDDFDERFKGLPAEHTGDDMRDALEALPEGDKLAIEAIEGLQEQLESLKKQVSGGGGGAQGGITAVHAPLHEEFVMNGSDTYVTLSQGVGAAGRAIFGLRYQGQTQNLGTDYTVNGNRIDFVSFVPEADTIIAITYLS